MEIKSSVLSVHLKSEVTTNLGCWSGGKLRSAIKSGVARRYCDSVRYAQCDKCNIATCMNKYLFDFKSDSKAGMQAIPVIIDSEFSGDGVKSDNISFKIRLFNTAIEYQDDIVDILESGIYLGEPNVRFTLDSVDITSEVYDVSDLSTPDESKKNATARITFESPIVTNSKSGVTPLQIIRSCTTRITSMVNTCDLDYCVEYGPVIEAAKEVTFSNCTFNNVYYGKKSSRTNRFATIHGVVGSIDISGDLSKIYKYIELASKLNIGKECSMGFGKFNVEAVAL